MAICPHCHTTDKNFFAPRCHACNSDVGFIEQVFFSTFYGAVQLFALVVIFYILKAIF
jgi:hypothetical protein